MTAIDGYDPAESLYDFEWRDAAGFQRGSDNVLVVDEEGIFTVTVRFRAPADAVPGAFDSCPAERSAFVGPAFEFDINLSQDEVCYEDVVVTFAPDTPIAGEWFYQLQGTSGRTSLGEFFELRLNPLLMLPGPGTYEIIFVAEDPLVSGCLIEKITEIIVHPLPLVRVLPLVPDADCVNPDGSFEIEAITNISRLTIQETGQVFNTIAAGEILPTITGLAPGIYTLEMENNFGCLNVETVIIQNRNADPAFNGFQVQSEDETCGPMGVLDGKIIITLQSTPVSLVGINYRIIRRGDGFELGDLLSSIATSLPTVFEIIDVPQGEYAVEILDPTGCPIPFDSTVTVERKFEAEFSIPSPVAACEQFVFTPLSNQTLDFTLRDAAGNVIAPQADGSYTLNVSGRFTMRAEDPTGVLCPSERTMDLVISQPVVFTLAGPLVDNCVQGIFYEAQIPPIEDPATLLFIWRDSAGNVVGRDQRFFPREIGRYSLEVQRRNSGLCADSVEFFDVEYLPGLRDLGLTSVADCPLPETPGSFSILSVDESLINQFRSNIASVEWFRVINGIAISLSFDDELNVTVDENGIYRVVVTDTFGCIFGVAEIQVQLSEIVPPVLDEKYVICTVEGKSETISAGAYDFYEWTKDGVVVSTDSIFTPQEAGTYKLRVEDLQGCFFEKEFIVEENCDLDVRFPDAIILGNNDKNFLVYPNEFVDKLEVFIYNRWGELIFFCAPDVSTADQAVCVWDGTVNGQFVPIGTYPVVVIAYSSRQGRSKTFKQPLIVLQ